ncbi:hypothetical protein ACJ73_05737 [Blastomyces percursus]|uniref:Folylpolyglutamate synthase n=1 Tax=Blastomyces percursus TaxID=1658174 RepID=A0A1J9R349_9EURO|nr:hypothetical protein ACJ73_05737 [Blastomyces percursus]
MSRHQLLDIMFIHNPRLPIYQRPKLYTLPGQKERARRATIVVSCMSTKGQQDKPRKIGCYTSPHQVENQIDSLLSEIDIKVPSIPGYPGFLALLAIYIFIHEEVDVAVIETGIGGETDSTNVFRSPVVTGITTIDLDHLGTLGSSIEEIARHKAGIFKKGCLAFTVEQSEIVLKTLCNRAHEVQILGELKVISDQIVQDYGISVDPNMYYQRSIASLAISLANAYLRSTGPDFVMTKALARSVERMQLPGRCQIKADGERTWFLSVAHNEVSLKETMLWFKDVVQQPK